MNSTSQPPMNGAADPVKRRIKKNVANPFATARQPGKLTNQPNGAPPPPSVRTTGAPVPQTTAPAATAPKPANPNSQSGFSDPTVTQYTDYKLVASKKDLLDGLRYHIFQLTGDKSIDVRDPSQFAQPAHLHRRDPRSVASAQLKDEEREIKDGLNEAEREDQSKRNDLRKAERAANLAQIAPTQAKKNKPEKLRTKTVYKRDFSEEEKRRIQTNYEEKLPWHLEDFDNKHCFVGENQRPSAHRHVALAYEPAIDSQTGRFRLVPVEKVYEFQPKRRETKAIMTADEVDKFLKQKRHAPEWLEQQEIKTEQRRKEQKIKQEQSSMYTGEVKSNRYAGRTGEGDDFDFDEDELFADDEEGDVIHDVKDEDEKLAERKIKEDNLKANFFDVKQEQEYDEEEEEERKQEEAKKKNFRKYRKALEKHEGDFNHASNSEYSFSSDSEDEALKTDVEKQKQQAEAQLLAASDPNARLTAPPSGATTPSGSKNKGSSDREGGGKIKRKRPGSPSLSEVGSGTDTAASSARNKKPKTNKHLTSGLSRPATPSNANGSLRLSKNRLGGAGSDTDAALSEAGKERKKKLKLTHNAAAGARSGTPASRAGSPPNAAAAGSPPAGSPPVEVPMPSVDAIKDAITRSLPEGLTVKEFILSIPHPKARKDEFVQLTLGVAKAVKKPDGRRILVLKDNAGVGAGGK